MDTQKKDFMLQVRVDPRTLEKLDRFAGAAAGGNRSEAVRQLIDLASTGQQSHAQERANWPAGIISK